MEWVSQLGPIPLGGSIASFIGLLVWLIKRGDLNVKSDIKQLREQRDDAWDRAETVEARLDECRRRVNRAETELVMYRRAFGPLDQGEQP